MHIRRVRADEGALRRYMEELWIPFNEELGDIVESAGLSEEFEVDEELEWHVDQFDTPENRLWVALDDVSDPTTPLETIDATFAGFISTILEPAPPSFESPDQLVIGDFYVREQYRGTGLADDLVARAVQVAREDGCPQLALDVDAGNERARAYYEKLGFEPTKFRLCVPVDDIDV